MIEAKCEVQIIDDDGLDCIVKSELPRLTKFSKEMEVRQKDLRLDLLFISRDTFNRHQKELRAYVADYRNDFKSQHQRKRGNWYTQYQQWCHLLMVFLYKCRKGRGSVSDFIRSNFGQLLFSQEVFQGEFNQTAISGSTQG
jgi:hypothetical protein